MTGLQNWIVATQTPCSKVLLEELSVLQLVKKFLALYGTRRFIIMFTIFRRWTLS
jgi:hypothetical protein